MSFVAQHLQPHITPPHIEERSVETIRRTGGYDAIVRVNIQTIRSNLQSIEVNLSNLNRNFISRRIVESLHDKLKQTFEVILQTEGAFKSWKQQQGENGALQTLDQQRDRFLYEKLFSHFQEEIKRVQILSERVREAAERASDPLSQTAASETVRRMDFTDETVSLDMERDNTYGTGYDADNLFLSEDREIAEFDQVTESDSLLTRAVAEERFRGIRNIHSQVSQANHIFRDLANLVFSQGETLNSIESQMQGAHLHSKAASTELRQASRMQQRSRQRSSTLSAEPSKLATVKGRAVIEDSISGEAADQKGASKVFIANPPAVSVPSQAASGLGGDGGFKPHLPVP